MRRPRVIVGPSITLGRRGAVLFWLGLTWVAIGVGVASRGFQPWPSLGVAAPAVEAYYDLAYAAGAWWLTCGVLAVLAGLRRRRPVWLDWLGYASLVAPATLCFALWVGKVVRLAVGIAPSLQWRDFALAGVNVVLWLSLAGVIVTCAGWVEPSSDPLGERAGE